MGPAKELGEGGAWFAFRDSMLNRSILANSLPLPFSLGSPPDALLRLRGGGGAMIVLLTPLLLLLLLVLLLWL